MINKFVIHFKWNSLAYATIVLWGPDIPISDHDSLGTFFSETIKDIDLKF